MNSTERGHLRFSSALKIRSSAEYQACQRLGKKFHGRRYVVIQAKNDRTDSRLGIIVTKKTGSAVVRNAWRRMIREEFRTHRHVMPAMTDFVVIVRSAQQGKPDPEARNELHGMLVVGGARN